MTNEILNMIASYGSIWTPEINQKLVEAYEPLHAAQRERVASNIQVHKRLKYGPGHRNYVDVRLSHESLDKYAKLWRNHSLANRRSTTQVKSRTKETPRYKQSSLSMQEDFDMGTQISLIICIAILVRLTIDF